MVAGESSHKNSQPTCSKQAGGTGRNGCFKMNSLPFAIVCEADSSMRCVVATPITRSRSPVRKAYHGRSGFPRISVANERRRLSLPRHPGKAPWAWQDACATDVRVSPRERRRKIVSSTGPILVLNLQLGKIRIEGPVADAKDVLGRKVPPSPVAAFVGRRPPPSPFCYFYRASSSTSHPSTVVDRPSRSRAHRICTTSGGSCRFDRAVVHTPTSLGCSARSSGCDKRILIGAILQLSCGDAGSARYFHQSHLMLEYILANAHARCPLGIGAALN